MADTRPQFYLTDGEYYLKCNNAFTAFAIVDGMAADAIHISNMGNTGMKSIFACTTNLICNDFIIELDTI